MFGLGSGEILVIVLIALVLFGKEDLPKTLRKVTKGINEIKKVTHEAQRSWNEVRDDVQRAIMAEEEKEYAAQQGASQPVVDAIPASTEHAHPDNPETHFRHPESPTETVAETLPPLDGKDHYVADSRSGENEDNSAPLKPAQVEENPSEGQPQVSLPTVRVPAESVAQHSQVENEMTSASIPSSATEPKKG